MSDGTRQKLHDIVEDLHDDVEYVISGASATEDPAERQTSLLEGTLSILFQNLVIEAAKMTHGEDAATILQQQKEEFRPQLLAFMDANNAIAQKTSDLIERHRRRQGDGGE